MMKLRDLLVRLILGRPIAELLQGYRPPEGKHNSLITGSPTSWTWGKGDHGAELDGLGDDDHTQYLNNARHDTTERHPLGTVVPHDKLSALANPDANVEFAKQQALQFVVENRTSDPPSPVNGQIWLRTDL